MKKSELKQIIREEVKKVLAYKSLTESAIDPKSFTKLFIQNVKNGLVTKPVTFKDLKDKDIEKLIFKTPWTCVMGIINDK